MSLFWCASENLSSISSIVVCCILPILRHKIIKIHADKTDSVARCTQNRQRWKFRLLLLCELLSRCMRIYRMRLLICSLNLILDRNNSEILELILNFAWPLKQTRTATKRETFNFTPSECKFVFFSLPLRVC